MMHLGMTGGSRGSAAAAEGDGAAGVGPLMGREAAARERGREAQGAAADFGSRAATTGLGFKQGKTRGLKQTSQL